MSGLSVFMENVLENAVEVLPSSKFIGLDDGIAGEFVARLGHVRLNDYPDWHTHGEEVVLVDGDRDEGLARLVRRHILEKDGHDDEADE